MDLSLDDPTAAFLRDYCKNHMLKNFVAPLKPNTKYRAIKSEIIQKFSFHRSRKSLSHDQLKSLFSSNI